MTDMGISTFPPGQPTAERRSGQDRRISDLATQTGRERRRSVEPRMPEVFEIAPSDSEWASFDLDRPAAGSESSGP